MNTPRSARFATAVVLTASLLAAVSLSARVGETQGDVERRLLQPNLGKMVFKSKDKDGKDDRQQQREERDQPFAQFKDMFPPDTREGTYWKTAVSSHLSSDNGWKVHVFYVAGRSALEAYRRVGESLSEFEVRALLAANKGASSWKKIQQEGGGTNGMGYDYELEDGSLRARQQGSWLVIFSTKLDNYVVEQQKEAKELSDQEKARKRQEQQNKAPESVAGF